MDRVSRFIQNKKQNKIQQVANQPSVNSMREGEEVLYLHKNGQLIRYRKQQGKLWSTPMSSNGDFQIDKQLKSNSVQSDAIHGNNVYAHNLMFKQGKDLRISSGVIVITHSLHLLDTEGSASSDNLDQINNGQNGQLLILKTKYSARDVTIRHDEGNILTNGEGDIVLNTVDDTVMLFYFNLSWYQILKSDSGS
tara:strand:- start:503 stop:1084 length:582 start_codon:yes stop_codon:yes gene_type:complete